MQLAHTKLTWKLTAVWERGKPTAIPTPFTYSTNKHLLRLYLR